MTVITHYYYDIFLVPTNARNVDILASNMWKKNSLSRLMRLQEHLFLIPGLRHNSDYQAFFGGR